MTEANKCAWCRSAPADGANGWCEDCTELEELRLEGDELAERALEKKKG